ncbi:response regulator [Branchiibius cervicis]|uniref:Response regulator n=1 Tax=Branchiibius cervicis TaxID=908252 RepID=A0ABW2APP2_9MICO
MSEHLTDQAPGSIRIGVVDDHPIVLRGVISGLAQIAPDIEVDFLVSSVKDLDWDRNARPDLVLLDVDLDDGSDPEANVAMVVGRGLRVLLFTASTRPAQLRALVSAGASGLALKSDPEEDLVDAIRSVAAGNSRCPVTSRKRC